MKIRPKGSIKSAFSDREEKRLTVKNLRQTDRFSNRSRQKYSQLSSRLKDQQVKCRLSRIDPRLKHDRVKIRELRVRSCSPIAKSILRQALSSNAVAGKVAIRGTGISDERSGVIYLVGRGHTHQSIRFDTYDNQHSIPFLACMLTIVSKVALGSLKFAQTT
jgi:hypothetical protein